MTNEININKCLFRIEPPKKYFHRTKLNQLLENQSHSGIEINSKLNSELSKNAAEEIMDYESTKNQSTGLPVTYGQSVIFRHLHSNSYVTLDAKKLAKQIGAIKILLKEDDNEYTNMKVLPSSKVKKIGDLVNYLTQFLFVTPETITTIYTPTKL